MDRRPGRGPRPHQAEDHQAMLDTKILALNLVILCMDKIFKEISIISFIDTLEQWNGTILTNVNGDNAMKLLAKFQLSQSSLLKG